MKKAFISILVAVAALLAVAGTADAAIRVNGYLRSNGTYVQPYYRSSPNSTKLDNWSTYGNYNPYTGKRGTIRYR